MGGGKLGADFINYLNGNCKLGDTPSLLYMMDGDPDNPMRESWGGSFAPLTHSPRVIIDHPTTAADTVPIYSIMEFRIKGPKIDIPADSFVSHSPSVNNSGEAITWATESMLYVMQPTIRVHYLIQ